MAQNAPLNQKVGNVVGTTATLVYRPVGSNDSVTLINEGRDTAYIGQSAVTATTGLPLVPGDRLTIQRVPFPIYAVGFASSGAPFVSVVAGVR